MPIVHKKPDENESTSPPQDAPATTETTDAVQAVLPRQTATAPPNDDTVRPRRRGFAAMDRDRVKLIASKGGRAAHAAGTAHQFNSDEARIAGRKGGMAPHVRRGGVRRRPATEASHPSPSQNEGKSDER